MPPHGEDVAGREVARRAGDEVEMRVRAEPSAGGAEQRRFQHGGGRLDAQQVAGNIDHAGCAGAAERMTLFSQHLQLARSLQRTSTNTPPAKLASSAVRSPLKTSSRRLPASSPPSARSASTLGTSATRAMGAWKSGRSGVKPVALATTSISHRSGTARCGSAAAIRARAVTISSTGRSPSDQNAARSGASMVLPLLVRRPEAGSNTKSYSLDLPAATISSPNVSAQVMRPMSRLG